MTARVKICGLCTNQDALAAAAAGAGYVGVILSPGYRRSRTVADAVRILDGVRAARVGVFVDAPVADVIAAARRLGLSAIQLHGSESHAFVDRVRRGLVATDSAAELWKVVRVRDPHAVSSAIGAWADGVAAIVLDGWSPDAPGGAATSFAWRDVALDARPRTTKLIVAGGLTAENVADAIALLHPDVVDVSSGVEDASGRKSAARMESFIAAAHDAFATMELRHD
jgi:phosphoribosylanthranilate isomerase